MKSLFPFLLALCLLSGCTAKPSASDTVPSVESVKAVYEEAAQVYDWFDLAAPPCTGDSIEVDGLSYHQVDCQGLHTYADLEEKVNSLFAPTLAQTILENDQTFREMDGKLYCVEGSRGSDLMFFDKTVTVEQVDEDHFTVELLFWTDWVETEDWTGCSSFTTTTPVITTGYSREVLNYERTDAGFRFTNFCSSDALDLEADTVLHCKLMEAYESQTYRDYTDWQLLCYLLHADGALAEAPSDLLLRRFMDHPQDMLQELALLYRSPFYSHENYSHVKSLVVEPAYSAAAWLSQDEQAAFTLALDACKPQNEAEAAVLEQLRSTYQEKLTENQPAPISQEFSLILPGEKRVLTLDSQTGKFPWGFDLEGTLIRSGPADTFGTSYEMDCGSVQLRYASKDGVETLYKITTTVPYTESDGTLCTSRGLYCGYTEDQIQEIYPNAVKLEDAEGYDSCYVYEPGGEAACKHISFFVKDGVVAKIEIEDLIDGRILE